MNQNLDFAAVQSLQADLSSRGYQGSVDDLLRSVQRASTESEYRRFLSSLGMPAQVAKRHPLTVWLAGLTRHFEDVTYRADSYPVNAQVLLEARRHKPSQPDGGTPRELVKSAAVSIRQMHDSTGSWDVFVRYYSEGRPNYRRAQTSFFLAKPLIAEQPRGRSALVSSSSKS